MVAHSPYASSNGFCLRIPGLTDCSDCRQKLYTKSGDGGSSMLFNGKTYKKSDTVFHCLGDIDELNSQIGVARTFSDEAGNGLGQKLEQIQCWLIEVGSDVATPKATSTPELRARMEFSQEPVLQIEAWIDQLEESLPPLKAFILPSGGKASSFLHVARTVCRRTERTVVSVVGEESNSSVRQFVNRLSDFLFVAARFAAKFEGVPEREYRKQS